MSSKRRDYAVMINNDGKWVGFNYLQIKHLLIYFRFEIDHVIIIWEAVSRIVFHEETVLGKKNLFSFRHDRE